MTESAHASAHFVLAHLLTKDGELSTGDINTIQRAVLETGDGDFGRPNGVFGPGTAEGVMEYLSEEGLDIVMRLSPAARDALAAQGYEDGIMSLQQTAAQLYDHNDAPLDPTEVENKTIESLISQPYALSEAELIHLHTLLHERGMYELDSHEFTRYADGSPTRIHPDGLIGRDTILGIHRYIQENPEAVLQNPEIIAHGRRSSLSETINEMAQNSTRYDEVMTGLIENQTGGVASAANYHLQMMLSAGGYAVLVDGAAGRGTQDAIREYQTSNQQGSLRQQWDQGGTDFAQNDTDPAETPGADPKILPPTLT